ncbi:MAG: universal stress protein, partial [Quisquiliibacterium sp.]
VSCETALLDTLSGSVGELIAADASGWKCDLIVMGTHGRRGVKRAVMGSDAELVVRAAGVPVLMVKAQTE